MASLMASLHSLDQDDPNEVQHDFFVHMTPLLSVSGSGDAGVLSIAPLHSKGQDNPNEIQHDIFGHVRTMALASLSHDPDSGV